MIKFKDLFRRQKTAGRVHVQSKPEIGTHEHVFFEMPCDMGRKVFRRCTVAGCSHSETVAATATQRTETAPLADAVRGFQEQILDDVEAELRRKKGQ